MRGLWSVAGEFFREAFELDSRVLRTLTSLFFRPGHLSGEFSRNRRASYSSPVRLYLFSSFLFFLVLSISAGGWLSNAMRTSPDEDPRMDVGGDPAAEGASAAFDSAPAVREPTNAPEDSALADRAQAERGAPADGVEVRLSAEGEGEDRAADSVRLAAFRARLSPERARKFDDVMGRPGETVAKQVVRGLAAWVESDEHGAATDRLVRRARDMPPSRWATATAPVIDFLHSPEDFLQQAIGNLPVAMFFLLPVFAAILALCHLRRRRFYVEHLVFGMHIHSFAFLMLAAALLVPGGAAVGSWLKLFFVFVSPFYALIAMRRFYGEGWGRTLVKGFVVWNLYSFALLPGFLLAILIRT